MATVKLVGASLGTPPAKMLLSIAIIVPILPMTAVSSPKVERKLSKEVVQAGHLGRSGAP